MLEYAYVITTGGLLLFSTVEAIDRSIIFDLVNRIIDSKNLEAVFVIGSLKVNYLYDALLGLVFVICWRKEIELEYPQKLLQAMSLEWKAIHSQILMKDDLILKAPGFQQPWDKAFSHWMAYCEKKEAEGKKMKVFPGGKESRKKVPVSSVEPEREEQIEEKTETSQSTILPETDPEWENLSPRQRFLKNQELKKKNSKADKKSPGKNAQSEVKQARDSFDMKVDKKAMERLDRSARDKSKSPPKSAVQNLYLDEKQEKPAGFLDSDEEGQEDLKTNSFLNRWVGKFKNVVGDKQITKEDLNEVLGDFKSKLMEKNVAQDVANQVAEAVGVTLLEKKTESFTSVHKTVKNAMKEALRKILTPKRKIDLVVEVTKEREKLKPYVIVFVGVNGVGKSTNLAKVAYKLKSAKLSVMLAACDNFRAGAVEQIQTHGERLGIPVFQKGYKEEPAHIAYEAIKDATKKRIDAVLVDTAGRMQDNSSLMKELARLVKMNKPNLVVFIGEALVGNDAVDQITKFNGALNEESTESFKPQIDAILLSKFDTVDDKVGTALSLVYSTSKPIIFVGVGQKYPNLKELNVSTVVQALLN